MLGGLHTMASRSYISLQTPAPREAGREVMISRA